MRWALSAVFCVACTGAGVADAQPVKSSAESASIARAGMPAAQPVKSAAEWSSVVRGSLIEVAVERAVYEEVGDPHFFIHVRIQNLTTAAIGVDLRKPNDVFHPNQWGPSRSIHRGAVDEMRFLPLGPPDPAQQAAEQAEMVADYRAGLLTPVPPSGALDYYISFNGASGRSDRTAVDTQSIGYPYVLIVVDGRLRASDGRIAERVDAPFGDDAVREIAVTVPVRWVAVPRGARVIPDR